jgi:peptidoglycan/LPS O-acetylase OafA/YrhL
VATVGAVITDLLYTAISLGLVHMVGQTLSRNSRAFLPQKPGQDGMAEAVSRVLVVAYYLLALGFIALTMPTWSHVSGPGQAMELLSVQVGILLLVLGGLHLAGTAVLARLRRNRPWLTRAAPAGEAGVQAPLDNLAEDGAAADQRPRSTPFWRPQHRDTVN